MNHVLVTSPPDTIDVATRICAVGGIVSFLGIGYGEKETFSLNSNVIHGKKLQIRASNAIPALYFPQCFDLMKAGIVDVKKLITHTFPLEKTPEGITAFLNDHDTAVKAVMINR